MVAAPASNAWERYLATGDDRHDGRAARPAAAAAAPAVSGAGADVAALKRELRELLDSLRA